MPKILSLSFDLNFHENQNHLLAFSRKDPHNEMPNRPNCCQLQEHISTRSPILIYWCIRGKHFSQELGKDNTGKCGAAHFKPRLLLVLSKLSLHWWHFHAKTYFKNKHSYIITCLFCAPSPAHQICSLPHRRSGSHGNETSFICCFVAPPLVPPPPWHSPNRLNAETLASLLILLKLTVWGLEGCKLKPPHSDVYHW